MKLKALYWMPGTRGYWRACIGLNVHCSAAVVAAEARKDSVTRFGMGHAGG